MSATLTTTTVTRFPFWQKMVLLLSFCCSFNQGALHAQVPVLPAAYYQLKTAGEKAAYLRKIAGDSVRNSRYTYVPYLCHTALGYAAQSGKDSLYGILYQLLGDSYATPLTDSAIHYYRLSLATFKKPPLLKRIYLKQSLLYCFLSRDDKDSILHYTHALENEITQLPDTNKNKLNVTNTIAQSYSAINNYTAAISNYKFVIQHALKIHDTASLCNALVNTGVIYNEILDNKNAVYYTIQALPYLGDNDYNRALTYSNIAGYYSSDQVLDSTKYFLTLAEKLAARLNDSELTYSIATRRAHVLATEKKYAEAEKILAGVLHYFQQKEPGSGLANALLLYASVDTAMNKYKQAEHHLLTLYELTRKFNNKVFMAEGLKQLVAVYEHQKDYRNAYSYQKTLLLITDSIKADKAAYALTDLQMQYDTYKKQELINSLQKEGKIRSLELQAALRNKTLVITISCILLLSAAVILYILHLRSKTAMQQMKAELEMKALRSQMNPHFIFNSLNSVQKYIWENKQEDASEYLTKFARLIRLVLENSLHSSVTLSEELHALRLYIEMEHRRNNQKFDYSITTAEHIDAAHTWVPPLLFQPYVENAIWHGLSPKDEHGQLSVRIEKTGHNLTCIIDDNGIGRKQAATLKKPGSAGSLAMNISSQRIAWLQKKTGSAAAVHITDKQDGARADGTTVTITLPLIVKA